VIRGALILLIRGYQCTISRITPGFCRFHPSCSNYALVSLRTHGLLRGGWLALRRILRCHPFHPGGYDPVPGAPPPDATTTREEAA